MTRLPVLQKSCGSCTACCGTLRVEALGKADYERCKHLRRGPIKGCGIYKDRPEECSVYECLWLAWADAFPELRPDRCGFVLSGSKSDEIGHYIMIHELYPGASRTELANKVLSAMAEEEVIIEITRDGMRKIRGGPTEIIQEMIAMVQERMEEGVRDRGEQMNLQEILSEIETALPKVVWRNLPAETGMPKDAEMYDGQVDGWSFLILSWVIADNLTRDIQIRRYDGTATKGGVIMRLTPELAKLAGELAK